MLVASLWAPTIFAPAPELGMQRTCNTHTTGTRSLELVPIFSLMMSEVCPSHTTWMSQGVVKFYSGLERLAKVLAKL